MPDHDDIRRQLKDLDEQLARLRGDSTELTDQVGGQADGAQDAEDTSAALTNVEETDALIAILEQRRERLRSQL